MFLLRSVFAFAFVLFKRSATFSFRSVASEQRQSSVGQRIKHLDSAFDGRGMGGRREEKRRNEKRRNERG